MIYNKHKEYRLKFYQNLVTRKKPIDNYLNKLGKKERAKIAKYLEVFRTNDNLLTFSLAKHIRGKIWELRIDFLNKRYRLLYCILDRQLIILHVFLKKTAKTPNSEILMAQKRYNEVLKYKQIYE